SRPATNTFSWRSSNEWCHSRLVGADRPTRRRRSDDPRRNPHAEGTARAGQGAWARYALHHGNAAIPAVRDQNGHQHLFRDGARHCNPRFRSHRRPCQVPDERGGDRMSVEYDIPLWIALPVSAFLLIGAFLTLTGTIGLIRLRIFYDRLHAPTLGSSWGTGAIVIASMILFSYLESRPVVHEILIGIFVTVTT